MTTPSPRRILRGARRRAGEVVRQAAWPLDAPPVRPRQVIVDLTDRCYFRCVSCDKWRTRATPPELATAGWRAALRALRAWLGPFHLSISGGEPLLRPDLLELIADASSLGCTINLMTNGWQVDAARARGLVAAGLTNLTLSLNGLRPETHDASRGMPGSHARIVAAVDHFNRARGARRLPTLSLNVIVAGYNARELPDLVRWAREAPVDAVGLQPLVDIANYQPYGDRRRAPAQPELAPPRDSPLWAAPDGELPAALDELIALKRAGYPILNTVPHLDLVRTYFTGQGTATARSRCYVGLNSFLIDPYGGVRLCYTLPAVGNILDESPGALWAGARARAVRRQVRACALGCRLLNCNYQGR
jgi:MoaA/NifB/PqqE/SkfB family radical SAM enzyme